eukprot:294859-Ditylum_brightwellii.AAC.1
MHTKNSTGSYKSLAEEADANQMIYFPPRSFRHYKFKKTYWRMAHVQAEEPTLITSAFQSRCKDQVSWEFDSQVEEPTQFDLIAKIVYVQKKMLCAKCADNSGALAPYTESTLEKLIPLLMGSAVDDDGQIIGN